MKLFVADGPLRASLGALPAGVMLTGAPAADAESRSRADPVAGQQRRRYVAGEPLRNVYAP